MFTACFPSVKQSLPVVTQNNATAYAVLRESNLSYWAVGAHSAMPHRSFLYPWNNFMRYPSLPPPPHPVRGTVNTWSVGSALLCMNSRYFVHVYILVTLDTSLFYLLLSSFFCKFWERVECKTFLLVVFFLLAKTVLFVKQTGIKLPLFKEDNPVGSMRNMDNEIGIFSFRSDISYQVNLSILFLKNSLSISKSKHILLCSSSIWYLSYQRLILLIITWMNCARLLVAISREHEPLSESIS